jgi:hypothetical protein
MPPDSSQESAKRHARECPNKSRMAKQIGERWDHWTSVLKRKSTGDPRSRSFKPGAKRSPIKQQKSRVVALTILKGRTYNAGDRLRRPDRVNISLHFILRREYRDNIVVAAMGIQRADQHSRNYVDARRRDLRGFLGIPQGNTNLK